jgi:PKD repeat protein
MDIDGEVWASPPSIGCDEFYATSAGGPLFVAIGVAFTNVSVESPVSFTALIDGQPTESIWNFGDGVILSNRPYASHAWSAPGDYEVSLRAYNENTPGGENASVVVHVTAPPIFYVDAASVNPAAPYTNWLTAAKNIQDAVDAAIPGALVLVTNGVYDQGGWAMVDTMTNRVAVDKQLTLQSVNGPQFTFIEGNPVPETTNGNGAIRCVYLIDGAVLSGFTLTNGATLKRGSDWYTDESGGGVWCQSVRAVVTNCVIAGNSASYAGGGVYSGTLYDCVLKRNLVKGDNGSKNSAGGGAYYSTLIDCTVAGNRAEGDYGCGGGVAGAVLDHCTVKDNSAMSDGGGVYWGCSLTNCTLIGNSAGGYGGGASGQLANSPCILYNCFLADNSSGSGGGASGSRLYNCTLTGNSVDHFTGMFAYSGGGVSFCSLLNCIVYYNTAVWGTPNYDPASAFTNCCTTPLPANGPGNISFEPQLASASHLSANSPCLGAGLAGSAIGTDIDGKSWANPPSIGCDEYLPGETTGPLTVAIVAELTNTAVGTQVPLRAVIEGQTTASRWDFGDGVIVSNRPYASHAWTAPGDYAVALRVYNDSEPNGLAATLTVHVAGQSTHYVAANSTNPVSPFTSWTTAATNIQDAVDAARTGDEIVVGDGLYAVGGRAVSTNQLLNRIAVTNMLSLRSANGPQFTFIQGAQAPNGGNGDGAIRCVYLAKGSSLSGFTLTNGATRTNGDFEMEQAGGGVFCESASATLSNCVIIGNTAFFGGGAYRGTMYNCLLNTNSATGNDFGGGGAYESILYNCTLTGNSANAFGGGGVSGGTLYNCIVYYNTALLESNYWHSFLNYCATTPAPTNGIGNAPLFVDGLSGNFHLQAVSPCINAGNNAYLASVKDFDGNPRIVGGTVDIGAYEFQNPKSVISYEWLEQYGLPTDGSADFVDTDGDGMSNWQEWRARTNPVDPRSALKMMPPLVGPAGVIIFWQSVSGQTYFLERSTNLAESPAFQTIASNIVGQATQTAYSDTNAVGRGPFYYRVSVR